VKHEIPAVTSINYVCHSPVPGGGRGSKFLHFDTLFSSCFTKAIQMCQSEMCILHIDLSNKIPSTIQD